MGLSLTCTYQRRRSCMPVACRVPQRLKLWCVWHYMQVWQCNTTTTLHHTYVTSLFYCAQQYLLRAQDFHHLQWESCHMTPHDERFIIHCIHLIESHGERRLRTDLYHLKLCSSHSLYLCPSSLLTPIPPQCPIVERLTNSLMMHGRNNGKKLMAIRIVKHSFEIINLLTNEVQACTLRMLGLKLVTSTAAWGYSIFFLLFVHPLYMYTHTTCTHAWTHTHAHERTHTHTHAHTYACAHTHTSMLTHPHSFPSEPTSGTCGCHNQQWSPGRLHSYRKGGHREEASSGRFTDETSQPGHLAPLHWLV